MCHRWNRWQRPAAASCLRCSVQPPRRLRQHQKTRLAYLIRLQSRKMLALEAVSTWCWKRGTRQAPTCKPRTLEGVGGAGAARVAQLVRGKRRNPCRPSVPPLFSVSCGHISQVRGGLVQSCCWTWHLMPLFSRCLGCGVHAGD